MTDPTHSPDDLDEVLSAVLDGEADDATRARVESDPASRARLEALRAARDLVAAPVPPLDEMTARRLRQAAIASGAPAAGTPSTASRRPAAGRWIASAAAVLLLLVVAVPVLGRLTSGQDSGDEAGDEVASVVLDDADDSADSPESMAEADAGADASSDGASDDGGAELGTAPSTTADLGVHGSDLAFADAALTAEEHADDVDRSSGETGASPTSPEALAQDLVDLLSGTSSSCAVATVPGVLRSFVGSVGGEDRVAYVFRGDNDVLQVVVVDPETCAVLVTRP